MIFSRIRGSVSRSARSRLQASGYSGFLHGRVLSVTESCLGAKHFGSPCISRVHGCLGLLKGYLTSNRVGASNLLDSRKLLENVDSVLANHRVRRLFSSESLEKRNYEIYYTMDKKMIPKEQEQKSESNGDSNTDCTYSKKQRWMFFNHFSISYFVFKYYFMFIHSPQLKQISFEEFCNHLLLEPGLVDHIEVKDNDISIRSLIYIRACTEAY